MPRYWCWVAAWMSWQVLWLMVALVFCFYFSACVPFYVLVVHFCLTNVKYGHVAKSAIRKQMLKNAKDRNWEEKKVTWSIPNYSPRNWLIRWYGIRYLGSQLKIPLFFYLFFFLAIYLLIHSCTKLNTKLCVILKFLCFLRVDIHFDPRIQIFVPRRKIALLWWAGTIRQLLAQPNYMLEVAHAFLYLLNQFCAYKTLTSLFPFLILHYFLSYVLKLWTNTNYWHR